MRVIGGLVGSQDAGDAGTTAPNERALLGLAAQLAAVTAVALPLLGFLARGIAFALCSRIGNPGPWHLAAADSLADLTVAGTGPVLVAVPAYLMALYQGSVLRKLPDYSQLSPGDHRQPRGIRWVRRLRYPLLVIVTVAVLLLGVYLFVAVFPLEIVLGATVGLVVVFWWLRSRYGEFGSFGVRWTWPILLVSLLVGSCTAAFQYSDVPVANYTIDSAAGVPSGRYLELGRTGDTVYLLSCTDTTGNVVGVSPASIRRAEYNPPRRPPIGGPSLVDWLTGRAGTPMGLQGQCP